MSQIQLVTLRIPSTAAGTADDFDIPWPLKGDWQLQSVGYAPDTADAADATDYTTLTVETMDVVANLAACTGTISNAATAFVVGTTRTQALSGAACNITEGDTVRIAKTEAGTGGILHGSVSLVAFKVP